MKIIGLDLSLTAPGYCTGPQRGHSLSFDPKMGDRRLCEIRDMVDHCVAPALGQRADLAVIESVPFGPNLGGAGALDRVHGVAREALARRGVPFAYVSPPTLKLFATGDSRADKAAMMSAAQNRAMSGWVPADDNAADAWHLWDMGNLAVSFSANPAPGRGWEDPTTAHMIRALGTVQWPTTGILSGVYGGGWHNYPRGTRKTCRHGLFSLKHADFWIHPFTHETCPGPSAKRARKTAQ